METKSAGRELFIRFTCRRCYAKAYIQYSEAMHDDAVYLHQSKLPDGWTEIGYDRHICRICSEAMTEFMNMKGV